MVNDPFIIAAQALSVQISELRDGTRKVEFLQPAVSLSKECVHFKG